MYLWIIQILYVKLSHFGLQELYVGLCLYCVFHLKGSQTQLDEDSGLCSRVFWQEGKHHVVHPKQRDQEQSGLGQPPAHSAKTHPWRRNLCSSFVPISMCLCMSSCADGYLFSSHLKWLVSLPPMPGDFSFWTRMRITLMKMMKFTYIETNEELSKCVQIVYLCIFCATTAVSCICLTAIKLSK